VSMLHTAAPYRRDEHAVVHVPVVMPTVDVTVDGQGRLDVLLDREPYSADSSLQRSDLQRVLDQMATKLDTPIRVEIHEPDGSAYTDIVVPRHAEPGPAGASPQPRKVFAPRPALLSPFGVAGNGFAAGEEVAVAIVVAHQVAGEDGTAHLRLPPAVLATQLGVVLIGRTSGGLAVSDGALS
jgi:hypothetical protein